MPTTLPELQPLPHAKPGARAKTHLATSNGRYMKILSDHSTAAKAVHIEETIDAMRTLRHEVRVVALTLGALADQEGAIVLWCARCTALRPPCPKPFPNCLGWRIHWWLTASLSRLPITLVQHKIKMGLQ